MYSLARYDMEEQQWLLKVNHHKSRTFILLKTTPHRTAALRASAGKLLPGITGELCTNYREVELYEPSQGNSSNYRRIPLPATVKARSKTLEAKLQAAENGKRARKKTTKLPREKIDHALRHRVVGHKT